ncbi:AraC family transcriptional regulator [Anseongella ginsenosidimutans]|uniref:AraC family transcriptional regulator n=1 Tax=Anseongella ginsenosidimutans TaxID=496056 RepID=A0A4R3KLL6_9SPHI|nr:AraC family transcriptional regulator [Anseongella ginsenosidimutans]QEC51943.1 helix-turn-helix transcriptional regulator [Anseongella ginsenosidimutans]TCS85021.1 AraC family transcriptional regulator [Anseongella ginsenosidimutans]
MHDLIPEYKNLLAGQYSGQVTDELKTEGIIAVAARYSSEESDARMHSHCNAHISFVLKGGSREKRNQSAYERHPGSIAFYHSGEVHQTIPVLPSTHINVEVEDCFLKKFDIPEHLLQKAVDTHVDLPMIMLQIYRELLSKDAFTHSTLEMLLLGVLGSVQKKEKQKVPSWILIVNEMMNDLWDKQPTLSDLSSATGVHPVTISKYFPVFYSSTFGEYMRKLKINRSITMLGHYSLTEIAYKCGFSDQSHFIRNFKFYSGFLPSELQNKISKD